jgi:hypothetical protein
MSSLEMGMRRSFVEIAECAGVFNWGLAQNWPFGVSGCGGVPLDFGDPGFPGELHGWVWEVVVVVSDELYVFW